MTEQYITGKYYMVPHVRGYWFNLLDWYPVIGPRHEDREIIKFPHEHWHIDIRFLSAHVANSNERYGIPGAEAFSAPIHRVTPEGFKPFKAETTDWSSGMNWIMAGEDDKELAKYPLSSYYRSRKVLCKRQYPPHPFHPIDGSLPYKPTSNWLEDLEEAYQGQRLKEGMVCPHRGADLSTFPVDDDGCVTCPLHALKWNARTGELVMTRRAAGVRQRRWRGHSANGSMRGIR